MIFMSMYSSTINPNTFNITIDGFPLIIEPEPSPNESYNRRETARHDIIGGTQWVARTTYVPIDVTFTTHVRIDPYYPDIYDSTFKLWMSKPVEVISREFGGKFNAECIVKKIHSSPAFLTLEIHLTEIPDSTTNIPGDEFVVPTDVISTTSTKSKSTSKKNSKKTSKKNKTKNKKNKKKGSKITKTK